MDQEAIINDREAMFDDREALFEFVLEFVWYVGVGVGGGGILCIT